MAIIAAYRGSTHWTMRGPRQSTQQLLRCNNGIRQESTRIKLYLTPYVMHRQPVQRPVQRHRRRKDFPKSTVHVCTELPHLN